MFQIDPVLWVQALESPALTGFLYAVTQLGYTPVYIALVIALGFGYRLRPSLALVVAMLLAGILTDGLKRGLALPRPSEIDARVERLAGERPPPVVDRGGASSFWSLPAVEAIAAVRARPSDSYGFPSGHVAAATAFFFGLALFFRSRHLLVFGIVWIPLMALSRMYLGRHFLADVLGGVLVGAAAVAAAAALVRRLAPERALRPRPAALLPLALLAALLLALVPFISLLDAENVGRLIGLVTAYGVVLVAGLPSDHGTVGQRFGRVFLAVLLYVATSRTIETLFDAAGWEEARLGTLALAALVTAITFTGTVAVSRSLKWYPVA